LSAIWCGPVGERGAGLERCRGWLLSARSPSLAGRVDVRDVSCVSPPNGAETSERLFPTTAPARQPAAFRTPRAWGGVGGHDYGARPTRSVLSGYTGYKNVYMADGPVWVQFARQYRHLLPSSAGTSIVFGGRPSTTSTSMRRPASGPRSRTAVIVGPISASEVPIFAPCIICRGGAFTALRPRQRSDVDGWRQMREVATTQAIWSSAIRLNRPRLLSHGTWLDRPREAGITVATRPGPFCAGGRPPFAIRRVSGRNRRAPCKARKGCKLPTSAFAVWPATGGRSQGRQRSQADGRDRVAHVSGSGSEIAGGDPAIVTACGWKRSPPRTGT
jgi:hypothetical protein